MSSVFERIIAGALPAEKVFENERILAIQDIHPDAPVHVLILPKKHFKDLNDVGPEDQALMGEIVLVAQQLAEKFGVEEGYRLVSNCGPMAGQTVFHLHFHLLGGRSLGALG